MLTLRRNVDQVSNNGCAAVVTSCKVYLEINISAFERNILVRREQAWICKRLSCIKACQVSGSYVGGKYGSVLVLFYQTVLVLFSIAG